MKKHTLRRLSALLAASVMAVVCSAPNAFAEEDTAVLTDEDTVVLAEEDAAPVDEDTAESAEEDAALVDEDTAESAEEDAALVDEDTAESAEDAAFFDKDAAELEEDAPVISDEQVSASIRLTSTQAVPGQCLVVNVSLEANNICTGYEVDVEFDDRLELKSVAGYMATETNGNVATVINLTPRRFADNVSLSSLVFQVPEDAQENDSYAINISRVGEVSKFGGGFIDDVTATGTTVSVLESAKKVTNHKVFVTEENGVEVAVVGLRGDANMDGGVGISDAVMIAGKMVRSSKLGAANDFFADVNGDGNSSLYDAIAIVQYMMSSDELNGWEAII